MEATLGQVLKEAREAKGITSSGAAAATRIKVQHIEALGLADFGQAALMMEEGMFDRDGDLPVNVSGGSLGMGNIVEGNGLLKAYESVLQLRGTAGERQIRSPESALVQTWRGVPTTSGAVMVLGNEPRGGA